MAKAPQQSDHPPAGRLALQTLDEKQIVAPGQMRALMGQLTPVLLKTVPAHMRKAVDRVGSSLVIEMNRNPYLCECTAISLIGGLMQASSLGLELGGVLGQAYLVPYFNNTLKVREAQFQIGYKGLIALAGRSPKVRDFDAHAVYENDEFDVQLGTDPKVRHKPPKKGDRGQLVGVYAVLHTSNGGVQIEWMTREQIDSHKAKYSKGRSGSTPWDTAYDEMARKTPLRRLGKRTPVSVELTLASTLDEYAEEGVDQGLRSLVRAGLEEGGAALPPPPSKKAMEAEAALNGDRDREPGEEG